MSFWDDLIKAGIKAKSGAKEIDLGDIKSPKLKSGPTPKPKAVPINEIELQKIKNQLELGDIPSQQVPLNEFDLGDITDPALKKGRPSSPISIEPNPRDLPVSRKKLSEVESSSMSTPVNEFDMGDIPGNLSVDDPKLPVLSQGLDIVGGNKVPALRTQTMPEEVGIKVLGKAGQSKYFKPDHVIDGDFIDSVDNSAAKSILEKNKGRKISDLLKSPTAKKALATVVTVAAIKAGYDAFGNQSVETSPSAKFTAPNISGSEETLAEEAKVAQKDRELEKGQQTKRIEEVSSLVDSFQDKQDDQEAKSSRLDYMNLMMNAQQAASQNNFANAILKAGIQAGNAISRSGKEADYTVADELAKTANAPVENVKKLAETEATQLKLNEMDRAEKEEAELKDPNSDISKFTVQQFAKYGLNIKTADQAKKMNPHIFNLLLQERAHKQAMDVAKIQEGIKAKKNEEALNEKQKEFIQKLRKEATTGVLGKQYATYSTGQRVSSAFEQFIKDPSGYKDYATLMGGLKSLGGDDSVVREAELRLGMSATSAVESVGNYFKRLATGESLSEDQRKEIINTVKILTEASKQQYLYSVQPILEQAQMEGIDPKFILTGSLSGVVGGSPGSSNLTTSNAGNMIKVTRKSDGKDAMMTAEEIAEMTEAEKEKYTIGK